MCVVLMQICTCYLKRQKLRQIVLYFLLSTLAIISCSKGPGFVRSYGENTKVTIALSGCRGIEVGQKFHLYISQDTALPESITFEYGSHIINNLSASIKDSIVKIKDGNHYNWVRNLNVNPRCTVNLHRLAKLYLNGACAAKSLDTLTALNLEILMDGVGTHELTLRCGSVFGSCTNSGHILFHGWGGILAWSCENGGWIDASDMGSADVYLYHYTDRDVFVNPGTIFKAELYGNGNAYYYQTPWLTFEKKENGKGKVLKK